VEPRVKVYGLRPLTRRQYLRQAVIGGLALLIFLGVWYAAWPELRQRLDQRELTPALVWVRAVLKNVPWILLGAAVFKVIEVSIVLRMFAARSASMTQDSQSREAPHGQAALSPVPEGGSGGEAAHPRDDGGPGEGAA
jgi:hypothetical protein